MSDIRSDADDPNGPNDPFDALGGPDRPVTPRAAFAERLRRRLETELGDLVTTDTNPARATTDRLDAELVNPGSLFYVTMPGPDVERSAVFYRQLFDWDLQRGDSGYHVANTYPPMGLASNPSTDPEVWIEVVDIDEAVAKVRELGGSADEPVHYDSGWNASCVDPNGTRFNLIVPRNDYRQPARSSSAPGELFYWTLPAPDAGSAR
ncbi:MAG: VOC family protein [Actinomycetota bacterium]